MKLRRIVSFVLTLGACSLTSGLFAQNNTTQLVIINNTGIPDDALYMTFVGGGATAFGNVTLGNGSAGAVSTSYSLAQLYGTVPGAGAGGPTGTVSTVNIGTFYNSFIDFTAGTQIGGANPQATDPLVSARFETYINSNSTQNNVDTSYVNFVSMPANFSIKLRADGSLVNLPGQTSQVTTTPGPTIFNLLTASTVVTPTDARIAANYNVVNSSGATLGNLTGMARVVGVPPITDYHSWLTPSTGNVGNTALIPWMLNNNIALNISSFTPPVGQKLAGTPFGYAGTAVGQGTSPFPADTGNLFLQNQSYNMNATFLSNLTTGLSGNEITALNGQGINGNTSGVRISGSGGIVGNFDVFIINSQLDNVNGIYGANPSYVAFWNGTAVSTNNLNNLMDRVVGDLMAGLNFGMATNDETVLGHAGNTSTTNNLSNSIFASGNLAANTTIGNLSTGEFFYLLSLQGNNTDIAKWVGSSLQSNPAFYNSYSGAFATQTDAYTFAFSDRLQGTLNPDVFYNPVSSSTPLDNLYIEITLNPGNFTYSAVPEPSTVALFMALGAGGLVFLRKRKRKR
jgi:hypothetical protein